MFVDSRFLAQRRAPCLESSCFDRNLARLRGLALWQVQNQDAALELGFDTPRVDLLADTKRAIVVAHVVFVHEIPLSKARIAWVGGVKRHWALASMATN